MKLDQGKFILIVEDSPTQAGQIEETLRRAGYSSRLAGSGVEALAILEKEKPSLVLADIVMPEMDGFGLCRSIKAVERLKDVPVILLTQLSDPREVIRGMECGAEDFLVKPYNEQALLARIEAVLSSGEAAAERAREKRIIVAEDSPTQAEQLRFLLERRGYSVTVTSNGQECLDLASKDVPSLIISDVMMPVMDGFELAHRVKKDGPLSHVPVILITSMMDRKDALHKAPVMADAFFTKPFDERQLLTKIESLLAVRPDDESSVIEALFAGERYAIRSGRRRILSFLLSTYENAVKQNRELIETQKELRLLNENLEERVLRRTRQFQESEANYRRLLETNADAIVVVGQDNTVFFMNRAAEELFGAAYAEMAGKQFFFLISGLGAKDIEVQKGGVRAYAEARTVSTTWGEKPALLAAFRETTERRRMEEDLKESERSFRALSENANDGIAILAVVDTCRIIYANRRLSELLGYGPGELLLTEFREIADMTLCPGLKEALEGGNYWQMEVPLMSRSGIQVQVEMAASKTTWHGQRAAILMVRDIAERKKRDEELLKASKLESLGTLAGGIAHDFNNLLTAIIGNISVARLLSRDNDRLAKPLLDAENASHRAKDLTKQLLTFSKGGLPLKKVTDLSDIIRESASFSLLGSDIRCEVEMPGSLPAVEADEGQISQVIHNLVINADQAMPDGGVVRITAGVVEGLSSGREGRFLRIQVADTGKGIEEHNLAKVFDPYFTTKKEGSGLGLATVYSVVKNHGGFVELESQPGKGTTFSIYLPVTGKPLESRDNDSDDELERGDGRILLMDDEEMVREAAATILRELGYEVAFAGHGAEALEKYGREMASGRPFDAVIMDLTIPAGMGGREAVKRLLELDPKARVIVSSGYSDDDIMSDFKRFGFSAVIAKPYRITDLSRTVKAVVEGRESR